MPMQGVRRSMATACGEFTKTRDIAKTYAPLVSQLKVNHVTCAQAYGQHMLMDAHDPNALDDTVY